MGAGWGRWGGEQALRRWPRTVARAQVEGGGCRQQRAPMWPMSSILMPVCSSFFPPVTSMSTWLAAQGLTVSGSTATLRQGGRRSHRAAHVVRRAEQVLLDVLLIHLGGDRLPCVGVRKRHLELCGGSRKEGGERHQASERTTLTALGPSARQL